MQYVLEDSSQENNLSYLLSILGLSHFSVNWISIVLRQIPPPLPPPQKKERNVFNKLMSVFHASVLLFDHEFRHNIVKVAVEPRGDSRVDPQDSNRTITGQTHEKLTSICFLQ